MAIRRNVELRHGTSTRARLDPVRSDDRRRGGGKGVHRVEESGCPSPREHTALHAVGRVRRRNGRTRAPSNSIHGGTLTAIRVARLAPLSALIGLVHVAWRVAVTAGGRRDTAGSALTESAETAGSHGLWDRR